MKMKHKSLQDVENFICIWKERERLMEREKQREKERDKERERKGDKERMREIWEQRKRVCVFEGKKHRKGKNNSNLNEVLIKLNERERE